MNNNLEETEQLFEFLSGTGEFVNLIKEAKENDGKIRFGESIKIAYEFIKLLQEIPNLKKVFGEFQTADNSKLQHIAVQILYKHGKNGKVKEEDLTDVLIGVQAFLHIIERNS